MRSLWTRATFSFSSPHSTISSPYTSSSSPHSSLKEILDSIDDAITPDNWLEAVEKWLALRAMTSIVQAEMVTLSILMDRH